MAGTGVQSSVKVYFFICISLSSDLTCGYIMKGLEYFLHDLSQVEYICRLDLLRITNACSSESFVSLLLSRFISASCWPFGSNLFI